MEGTTHTMASLIGDLSTVGSSVLTNVDSVANTIMGNSLLLFTTGFLFIGGCVGILGRLLSRN